MFSLWITDFELWTVQLFGSGQVFSFLNHKRSAFDLEMFSLWITGFQLWTAQLFGSGQIVRFLLITNVQLLNYTWIQFFHLIQEFSFLNYRSPAFELHMFSFWSTCVQFFELFSFLGLDKCSVLWILTSVQFFELQMFSYWITH